LETLKGTKEGYAGPSITYSFVEDIARQGGVDSARRRRMHQFFEVKTDHHGQSPLLMPLLQLSAEEQVKKIEELIRDVQFRR
jgi:hypothetical protein